MVRRPTDLLLEESSTISPMVLSDKRFAAYASMTSENWSLDGLPVKAAATLNEVVLPLWGCPTNTTTGQILSFVCKYSKWQLRGTEASVNTLGMKLHPIIFFSRSKAVLSGVSERGRWIICCRSWLAKNVDNCSPLSSPLNAMIQTNFWSSTRINFPSDATCVVLFSTHTLELGCHPMQLTATSLYVFLAPKHTALFKKAL